MARVAVTSGSSSQVGKLNGMGDIEFVRDFQPIQVGNRVWNDANGDGIQDAGETGISNVAIVLHSPGPDGIFGNGDDQNWTTTSDAKGNYYFDNTNITTADTRKPAEWTAVNGLLPGYDYTIEIDTTQASLAGFRLSPSDISGNSMDKIDNDGVISGVKATVLINTRFIDHNIDFGFKNMTSVGDYVWVDINSDGIQDAGEPGAEGVSATLYNAANNKIGSASTDATGNYTINNVTPGSGYYIIFSNVPGGNFTLQNIGGAGAVNNSKADSTGKSVTFNIAPGQQITNMDAGTKGIILPTTLLGFEAEKKGNAGLLQWTTSQEINSDYFEVMRSPDGVSFKAIGRVTATGNSSVKKEYSFTDPTPVKGMNYYHLKMMNRNGDYRYSYTRVLEFSGEEEINIYPNPAKNILNIILTDKYTSQPAWIEVYNQSGQLTLTRKIAAGQRVFQLEVGKWSNGVYILKIIPADNIAVYKKVQVIH